MPISVRLGSAITLIRDSGKKVGLIRCGPADFRELMQKGYLRPSRDPDVFLFDSHPVRPTAEVGTRIAILSDNEEAEHMQV